MIFFNPSKISIINFVTLDTELLLAPEILLGVEASTGGTKGQFKPEKFNFLFDNYSICLCFGIC